MEHVYTVYRVTNLINEKTYVGVHKTRNPADSYLGSGTAIKAAIRKYGRENFRKDVLAEFETGPEAYALERQLTHDFHTNATYNMKLGGVGGFARETAMKGASAAALRRSPKQLAEYGRKGYEQALIVADHSANGSRGGRANKGKPKSPEHRAAISAALRAKHQK